MYTFVHASQPVHAVPEFIVSLRFCTHLRYYINKVYLKVHAFRHGVYHSNHVVLIYQSLLLRIRCCGAAH